MSRAPEPRFEAADGPRIFRDGTPMKKRPNPVYLHRVTGPFTVETNEGPLRCQDGYVAYDPISGHVWPVDATYVQQHYEAIS